MNLVFDSSFAVMVRTPKIPARLETEAVIKSEPMLFSSSLEFARRAGGELTQAFLDRVPESWKESDFQNPVVIDSRSHMLMPGWYPCIPGWHLDDVPRTRPDGQPDHVNPIYEAEHIACVVGDCSLSSFLMGRVELPDIPVGAGVVYDYWNRMIDCYLKNKLVTETQIQSRELIHFTWKSFHRGTAATRNGWRWFIRASRSTHRPIRDEIRQQVQAYPSDLMGGW